MTDTSGPSGTPSFSSAALQSFLENRCRARLAGSGSTMFSQTWKTLVLPSGRVISRLAAWARPIVVNVCGLEDGTLSVMLQGWPTTTTMDMMASRRHGFILKGHPGTTLYDAALSVDEASLTGWPTPSATDHKGGYSGGRERREGETRGHRLDVVAQEVVTATPSPWATPVSTELGNTLENYRAMKANMSSGPRQAITHPSLQAQLTTPAQPEDRGLAPGGRGVKTEPTGRLNPALSLWLMGLPSGWLTAAPRFVRSRGRKSSKG